MTKASAAVFRLNIGRLDVGALLLFCLLAVILTIPVSLSPAHLARMDSDGRFSIWNVGWVAHALTTQPSGVWDANIFFPNRATLAYSEANLLAGVLAAPVYAATGSAIAAHNFVLVLSFALSAQSMYGLVHYLTRRRGAAVVAATSFAFCPFVFAHLSHIQLLMTAGLPLSLLAFHRMADQPTARRAAVLGLAMAGQTYACGYYGIFVVLLVGFSSIYIAIARRREAQRAYWIAVAVAAAVAIACVAPLVSVYARFAADTGFERPLDQARLYSANVGSYFASAAYLHAWMLPYVGRWKEVLFPGFIACTFGLLGGVAGMMTAGRQRETASLYISIAAVALWVSFGPDAGLYRLLHVVMPGFSLMRAPVRFGLIFQLSLSVLAGLGLNWTLERVRRPAPWLTVLLTLAVAESAKPLTFSETPPVNPVYRTLATLPDGGVIELPLYSRRFAFLRTQYMLASAAHWKPLVGGYSDYIPRNFVDSEGTLADFPSEPSLARLTKDGVRYAVIHVGDYSEAARADLGSRLQAFSLNLRLLDEQGDTRLYQIQPMAPRTP